ncbi:DMT family transporter [Tenacibaculum sp. MEBiC06402]|uniref:DMT family transporter n=1 Tax=unclassified Tenacibaculum TaxID=2635139 RepID=UPI003B9A4867
MRKAIIFMIISALSFSVLNILVKDLRHFNVYQIVFFRSAITLFFTIPLLIKNNIKPLGNQRKLLFARGIIGFVAMTLFFASLKYLKTGTAVSIRYISPIFAAIFAVFLLKEKIKWNQWMYFGIAFLGVLILKGFDTDVSTIGFLIVLGSAVLTGLVFMLIRKINTRDHPLVVINYFMGISTFISGIFTIFYWRTPSDLDWLSLVSLGVFGFIGQYYMTKAFQTSEINKSAPLKYIEVLFTMLAGVFWLDEKYTIIGLLGAGVVITGVALNTVFVARNKS